MKTKIRTLTKTALLLALLICLQWVGSFVPEQTAKQLVTGSLVNCVLAVTALLVGYGGGIAVALLSPIFAFLLGIAPNFVTVVPIMLGNTCFVVPLRLIFGSGKPAWRQPVALAVAAVVKFALLYGLVVLVICDVASGALMGKKLGDVVVLGPAMLTALPIAFGWMQLVTASVGGGLALALQPLLKKAIRN